ncbi:hypothetical protein Hdeb2414_s0009g00306691 [Helianthus debilis subsp. tardiflorus]
MTTMTRPKSDHILVRSVPEIVRFWQMNHYVDGSDHQRNQATLGPRSKSLVDRLRPVTAPPSV